MTPIASSNVTDSTEMAALQQQPPTRLTEQAADLLTKPADQTQQNIRPNDKNFQDPVKLSDQVQIDYQANKTLSIQDPAQMEESIKIADKLDQKWIGEQLLAVNNKLAGEISPRDKANVESTNQAFSQAINGLPESQRSDYIKLNYKFENAKTPEEAATAAKEMAAKYPEVEKTRLDKEKAEKPFKDDLEKQGRLESLTNASAVNRFNYAAMLHNEASHRPEDIAQSDKLMNEALLKASPGLKKFFEAMLNDKD